MGSESFRVLKTFHAMDEIRPLWLDDRNEGVALKHTALGKTARKRVMSPKAIPFPSQPGPRGLWLVLATAERRHLWIQGCEHSPK